MPQANLGEVELYYEVRGDGEPVLLVPASWWPSDTWKISVVPILSQRFKTIVFDCRGTGRSSKPTDGFTVTQFARDCIGLLAHLEISRCHAVGSCPRRADRPVDGHRATLVCDAHHCRLGTRSENAWRRSPDPVARYGARNSRNGF